MYPTFRYHPTLAPTGIKFTDEAAFNALSDEWVDTPAKFQTPEPEPEPDPDPEPRPEPWRKAKKEKA